MKLNWVGTALAAVALSPLAASVTINVDDEGIFVSKELSESSILTYREASILQAASTYAYEMMTYYKNNASDTPKDEVGIFPKPPYYWWESGAVWGGLIDYWAYTNDSTYVNTTREALVANFGPNNDLIMPNKKDQEVQACKTHIEAIQLANRPLQGNDDQAFWIFALLSALEYQFPTPSSSEPQYLDVAVRAFDGMAARWDMKTCNGGLKWQIYPDSVVGFHYKNSVSNGAFFALAARLARYTGNQTYVNWAVKSWDWSRGVGLIGDNYEIFDGTDDEKNCSDVNHMQWSYGVAIYLHGAATLYNYTNGSTVWQKRTTGLLDRSAVFFSPFKNSTNVMWEAACEGPLTCNTDQQSFKAYLARFLAKSAVLAPYIKPVVETLLRTSAAAAAKSCSGGKAGTTCGTRWYTGGYDGTWGLGQQLTALEVTQALLVDKAGAPDTQADVHILNVPPTTTVSVPAPTRTKNTAVKMPRDMGRMLGVAAGVAVVGVW
jgi:mannan endo-1,6-alpha-mannosidase